MAMLRIGTSGWHYMHWVGPFYPANTRAEDFLPYYAARFNTVEINSTFYGLPSEETVTAWRERTPEDFVFACKASRYITHMKKLKDPDASTERFLAAVAPLGRKLGPILFQLPPRWHANVDRLDRFLARLPTGLRFAFEFRDETWFNDAVYDVLRCYSAALCAYEIAGHAAPLIATAGFDYVRLHGPGEAYQGRYPDEALDTWAKRIDAWLAAGHDVYCYFDNDQLGYASADAVRLRDRLTTPPHGNRNAP